MITREYVRLMARYGRWQNSSIFAAAEGLSDEQRKQDGGAFFGSIHATLNHQLWGDQLWMSRFAGTPAPHSPDIPGSVSQYEDWHDLKEARQGFDEVMVGWSDGFDPQWSMGELSWYSGAVGREVSKPRWVLVMQMLNHGTHHRGQVHAMLTRHGAKPDDTDIPFMPAAEMEL